MMHRKLPTVAIAIPGGGYLQGVHYTGFGPGQGTLRLSSPARTSQCGFIRYHRGWPRKMLRKAHLSRSIDCSRKQRNAESFSKLLEFQPEKSSEEAAPLLERPMAPDVARY